MILAAAENAGNHVAEALTKFKDFNFSQLTKNEWMSLGEYYGLRVMLVIILMLLAWTLSGWAAHATRASLRRIRFDETLTRFLAKMVRWAILLVAVLISLGYFGIETTSFAAVLGASALAIGLAFQGTLSNFAAGAMLLIFRPYRVGNVVNVAGQLGKVDEIGLFTTTLDTFDNRRIIIPNSAIFGSTIENITHHTTRRVEVEVGTDYSADLDQTRIILNEAIASVPGVLANPAPAVVLSALGASCIDWSVRAWAPTGDYGSVKQALLRAVKMHLDEAEIGIPYPQMDVNLSQPQAIRVERAA